MKRPTFLEGVAVAFAASLLGSALYSTLTMFVPASVVLRGDDLYLLLFPLLKNPFNLIQSASAPSAASPAWSRGRP